MDKNRSKSVQDNKRKVILISMLILGVVLIYTILDYVNIASILCMSVSNINTDILSAIINIAVVLILYVISFNYIENKQIEKDNNAIDAVGILLKYTYQECLENLRLLDSKEIIRKYIIPKIDGNKVSSENKVIHNFKMLPFSTLNEMISMASNGYVDKETLNKYLDIKKEYQYIVEMKIIFFDLDDYRTTEQKDLYDNIRKRDVDIQAKLTACLNELEINCFQQELPEVMR